MKTEERKVRMDRGGGKARGEKKGGDEKNFEGANR